MTGNGVDAPALYISARAGVAENVQSAGFEVVSERSVVACGETSRIRGAAVLCAAGNGHC
jgi:hypothetical protein